MNAARAACPLLIALPLVALPVMANAELRPVAGGTYRYDTVETRTNGGVERRFRASRLVTFQRVGDAYEVAVVLDSIDQQAAGDIGGMFRAAMGALLHHPIRFRIDASGSITPIDQDATIAFIADAIDTMTSARGVGTSDRRSDAHLVSAPLRAMPPERSRAMLVSILAPLIAGIAGERGDGIRPVRVPNRPPLPPGEGLSGMEAVSRNAAGVMTIDVRASGDITIPMPVDLPGADLATILPTTAHTSVHMVRNIDSKSGLLIDSRERSETVFDGSSGPQRAAVDAVVTLSLLP